MKTVKSIHQIELEYNKVYYLESSHKPLADPPNPITRRRDSPSKIVFGYHPYWQGTKWQNYNYDLFQQLLISPQKLTVWGSLPTFMGARTDLINKAHASGVEVALVVTLFNKTHLDYLLSSSEKQDSID